MSLKDELVMVSCSHPQKLVVSLAIDDKRNISLLASLSGILRDWATSERSHYVI